MEDLKVMGLCPLDSQESQEVEGGNVSAGILKLPIIYCCANIPPLDLQGTIR